MESDEELYGYRALSPVLALVVALPAMVAAVAAVVTSVSLLMSGSLWGYLFLLLGVAFTVTIIFVQGVIAHFRRIRYRVPLAYVSVCEDAYECGWRDQLAQSPRATIFAKAMTTTDYEDIRSVGVSKPRRLHDGSALWGFFRDDAKERTNNPVYVAWQAARALDKRREPWSSMPRLLVLASIVGRYVADRKPEHARVVTELTLAWFDSGMPDDEVRGILAAHPAPIAKMVLSGVPAEYASAIA